MHIFLKDQKHMWMAFKSALSMYEVQFILCGTICDALGNENKLVSHVPENGWIKSSEILRRKDGLTLTNCTNSPGMSGGAASF